MKPISIYNVPQGTFRGTNFMTPKWLGYYKLARNYAELSSGTWLNNEPIFGVTVRPDDDEPRSKMFHSKNEALTYIKAMS